MFRGLILSIFLLSVISRGSFANDPSLKNGYRFKNRVYQLGKYIDTPPKPFVDFKSSLENTKMKFDLSYYMTIPKDQGERGACAYFSTTALIETLIKKSLGIDVNISEEYLIYHAKGELGLNTTGDGSSSMNNLQAFMKGFMLERDVPYQTSWFRKGLPCENYKEKTPGVPVYCYSHRSPSRELLKNKIKIKGLMRKYVPSRSSEIIQKMSEVSIPMIVSLPVHHKGWDRETGHCIHNEELRKECQENPDVCGRHSVMIYGYDQEKSVFLFKNSWGKDWGKKGYGTLPFEFIDKYSGTYAYYATIREKVILPEDYADTFIPKIEEARSISTVGELKVQSTIDGKFTNVRKRSIYFSSFLVHKNDDSPADEVVGDNNVVHVKTLKEFNKKYGSYVAGRFNQNADESGEAIFDASNPSLMEFPRKIIDRGELSNRQLYLRVSAYVNDDIEGWKQLYRKYEPVSF